ncbi:MAG: hypothetical protein CMQ17_05795 [Gammaproteobacteria bacterium]|jgi:hypothetical protein|nr:hypothetical protein [Gammaproteobacteria bacterium]|tara:strand:- start:1088 stop:1684 length:597 start_codon:yes stop_codon:yes gene_type:complete
MIMQEIESNYVAFDGTKLIAEGDLLAVALQLKAELTATKTGSVLVFGNSSGKQIDLDLGGSEADLRKRFSQQGDGQEQQETVSTAKTRGRPRLGVIGREVTLLPRHWQWLDRQRGSASAALRRLVDQERKATVHEDLVRQAQDSANRFMYAMAGNLQGFEEAVRSLYACDKQGFIAEMRRWPSDVKRYAMQFAAAAFT